MVCGSQTVSESYLGVSSRCLGSLHVILIINGWREVVILNYCLFSHSQKVLNFGVSVRCLEDVWKVPGGRVGDSGYCLVYWLSNKNHIWS